MNGPHSATGARPWYREPWPWLLMLPPLLSVAGGVTMIYLATSTPTALVVEDYARIEALTRDQFARDREAARLALTAELRFERDGGRIEVELRSAGAYQAPSVLTLLVSHATNPQADRQFRLVRYGAVYRADAQLVPGRYRVELMPEDRTWRLGAGAQRLDSAMVLEPQFDGV